MIHSLAGGDIKYKKCYDLVFVSIIDEENIEHKIWYGFDKFFGIPQINSKVLVPFGNFTVEATVLKVLQNVKEEVSPTNLKHLKNIYRIIN